MDGLRVRLTCINLSVLVGTLVLILISRLPIRPSALSFDNVNFAFALERFDPWMHQPQPPGYPFFIAEARLVNFVFHDAQTSFLFISTLVVWLSAVLAFALGRRIFGAAAGALGALLLIFNPTLWYSGLDSPLRPHLAFFSLLMGYFCWRMWNGEPKFALVSALALGIGGGFRPDLLVYLFPLWCAAMWKSGNSIHAWIRGIGIICGVTVLWLGATAYAVGGLDRFALLMWVYSFSAMTESASVLLQISGWDGLRHVLHMIAWNGVGMLSWAWIIPLWLFARRRRGVNKGPGMFLAVWVVPGMIAQAVVHVAAPGHTLFSVAAFCIAGGYAIASTCEALFDDLASRFEIVAAGLAVVANVLLFFNVIPMPAPRPEQLVYTSLRDGIHETTFDELRSSNQLSEASIRELKDLVRVDRPAVVVSTLGSPRHFRFLNSRIASYYAGDQDFWVVVDEENPPRASHIRGKDLIEIRYGSVVKVPVLKGARIIWLMDPSSPFRAAVSKAVALKQDGNLFYTDLDPGTSDFRVDNFQFVVGEERNADRIVVGDGTAAVPKFSKNE